MSGRTYLPYGVVMMPSRRFFEIMLKSSGARHGSTEGLADDVLRFILLRSARESFNDIMTEACIETMIFFIGTGGAVPVDPDNPDASTYPRYLYEKLGKAIDNLPDFHAFESGFARFLRTLDRLIPNARAPKLMGLPRRKFGRPGIKELSGLKVPEELTGYMSELIGAHRTEGTLTDRDADYLKNLIEKISAAPGYLRYLDQGRKNREVTRLVHIVRRLKSADEQNTQSGRDLIVSLGILLFNIHPSLQNAALLSATEPTGASSELRYQYSVILALNYLRSGRPDVARAYAAAALNSADNSETKAYVYVLQGCIAVIEGDYDQAAASLQAGSAISGITPRLKALIDYYTGVVLFEKGEYANALARFEAAGMQASDVLDRVAIHNSIGSCALQIGDDARADQEFQAVEKLSVGIKGAKASQCMLMISSYRSAILGSGCSLSKAYEHYRKALKIASGQGDYRSVADLLGNLGLAHARAGDHSHALHALNACMTYAENTGYWAGIRFAFWHIYHALQETGSPDASRFLEAYAGKYPELRDLLL